jgi:hypothetical protein
VLVSGVVSEFGVGPETELVSVDEVTIISSNRPPMQPVAATLANASGSNLSQAEKYESMLIKISNVRSLTQGGTGDPFYISQSLAGTDTLFTDDFAVDEAGYTPWRNDNLDVTGIIRFSGTAPFRRLEPRNWSEPPTGDIHVISKANVSGVPPVTYKTALLQNEPNPFNPTTKIAFTLAQAGHATLRIYSVDGKRVRTLFDSKGVEGPNSVVWDGRSDAGRMMATGVYLYRLVTADETQTRKMLLVK